MGRPHIEFIDALSVESHIAAAGPFAGAGWRMLSEDQDGRGDCTALVTAAGGWSGDLAGFARPVELFVLDGALEVSGRTATPGTYVFVPAQSASATLSSRDEFSALVMVEPESETDGGGGIEVVDTHGMLWTSPPVDGPVPQGIVVKRVRIDPVSNDVSWVAAVVPGWREWRAEVHETIEECFMIRGDILLGNRGVMGPGSYFWRPPHVEHGPMYSLTGGLFFFRSKGGRLETRHVDVPDWEQHVARYFANEPYFPRAIR